MKVDLGEIEEQGKKKLKMRWLRWRNTINCAEERLGFKGQGYSKE